MSRISNKEIDPNKESILNHLKEEYNLIHQKKALLKDNDKIIKEIYINIKNRIEYDPIITDKLKFKRKQDGNNACCTLY